MNRSRLVLGGVLVVALVGLGIFLYFFKSKSIVETSPEVALEPAPDFSLPDASGNILSLENLEGEVKIINFWASWSPYSRDELAYLTRLKEEYGDKISVLALNRDTNPIDGKTFLSSLGLGNSILFVYDKNDEYFKKVHGFAMPETLFLDREGNILFHQHGPMKYEEMQSFLESTIQ